MTRPQSLQPPVPLVNQISCGATREAAGPPVWLEIGRLWGASFCARPPHRLLAFLTQPCTASAAGAGRWPRPCSAPSARPAWHQSRRHGAVQHTEPQFMHPTSVSVSHLDHVNSQIGKSVGERLESGCSLINTVRDYHVFGSPQRFHGCITLRPGVPIHVCGPALRCRLCST